MFVRLWVCVINAAFRDRKCQAFSLFNRFCMTSYLLISFQAHNIIFTTHTHTHTHTFPRAAGISVCLCVIPHPIIQTPLLHYYPKSQSTKGHLKKGQITFLFSGLCNDINHTQKKLHYSHISNELHCSWYSRADVDFPGCTLMFYFSTVYDLLSVTI